MFEVGEVLAGKYEIKAVLGAGGMGTVYRARQMDLGRDVAIKVPLAEALEIPDFVARFSREAKTVARLVHDNIVQVYEYTHTDDECYIVMEYVEGTDLKHLTQNPPKDITVKDMAEIMQASLEGLACAHEYGIVHRDIKPHNIMVQRRARGRWRTKIMDFGIAHLDQKSNVTQNLEQLTMTGQAIGTPSYMSPEQIRGTGVTAQSDIYSFGCVIYYLFTKKTPFTGTGFTVAAAHLSEEPPAIRKSVPKLPEEIEAIVRKCLAKNPADRPQDASDLGQEVYHALEPIFAIPMSDIWPDDPDSSDSRAIPNTVADGPTSPSDPTVADNPTLTDDDHTVEDSGRSRESRQTQETRGTSSPTVTDQRENLTKTGTPIPGSSVEPTIFYPESAPGNAVPNSGASAPAIPQTQPSKSPFTNPAILGALILVPLLGIGLAVGIAVSGGGGSEQPEPINDGGAGGEIVQNGGSGPGELVEVLPVNPTPTVTPTPEPEVTQPPEEMESPGTQAPRVTPTIRPSPTLAEPTTPPPPTPHPAILTARRLEEDFGEAETLLERATLWARAATGSHKDHERLKELAIKFAEETALQPELIKVEGGAQTLGNANDQGLREESPRHTVQLSPFFIGKYEVTALEFSAFLNDLPKEKAGEMYSPVQRQYQGESSTVIFNEEFARYEPAEEKQLHPVNYVSWSAAKAYTDWLSRITNRKFSLPSEAQWEAAARARSINTYPWGDLQPGPNYAVFDTIRTAAVTDLSQGANAIGLYHMAGNVSEWCLDWYDPLAYSNREAGNQTDPVRLEVPAEELRPKKIHRGGGLFSTSEDLRNARRLRTDPEDAEPDIGFRIVLNPD